MYFIDELFSDGGISEVQPSSTGSIEGNGNISILLL